MTEGIKWWGYLHTNGTPQVKRFFSNEDISEAAASPFCLRVSGVYGSRDAVLAELTGFSEELAGAEREAVVEVDKAAELKEALRQALQYLECTDGRRGCICGCVVSTANYDDWHRLVEGGIMTGKERRVETPPKKKTAESIAPADNMQQVERYGKMVWENQEFEAMRKENCMCHTCARMKPGESTNCGIARQFYKICVQHGCAFILTRCEDWKEKDA